MRDPCRGATRASLLPALLAACLAGLACNGGPSEPPEPGPSVNLDPLPSITNLPSVTVSGSTGDNAQVTVTGGAQTAETDADTAGDFSVQVGLRENQANELRVVARNAAGTPGPEATATVIHDGIPPDAPTFTTDEFTNDNPATVTGTAEPNADVRVVTPAATATGTANGDGEFSVTVAVVENFSNMITATAIDPAGNEGTSATVDLVHDGNAPAVDITEPSEGEVTPAPPDGFPITVTYSDPASGPDTETFAFAAENTIIGLLQQDGTRADDLEGGTDLADMFAVGPAGASWQFDGTTYAFPKGDNLITASISDLAGNSSVTDSVTFSATAPTPELIVVISEADPGATEHVIPLGLTNLEDLGGINFDLNFDPAVVTVDSVTSTGRVGFAPSHNADTEGSSGTVTVVLFDVDGDPIVTGSDIIMDVWVTIDGAAAAGDSPITLSDEAASDTLGNATAIVGTDGWVTID